jgi:hypothetical protein
VCVTADVVLLVVIVADVPAPRTSDDGDMAGLDAPAMTGNETYTELENVPTFAVSETNVSPSVTPDAPDALALTVTDPDRLPMVIELPTELDRMSQFTVPLFDWLFALTVHPAALLYEELFEEALTTIADTPETVVVIAPTFCV